jgi:predicted RNA binding protein YcfA (HicA-like mRNA interferase family)
MAKKYREVRKALREAGWSVIRVTGSHERWGHPDGRRATVAGTGKSNQDMPSGTLAQIRRATGLEELR